MITVASDVEGRRVPHEFFGLSTDAKPCSLENGCKVTNGSIFVEMDTQTIYIFDEENQVWIEQ